MDDDDGVFFTLLVGSFRDACRPPWIDGVDLPDVAALSDSVAGMPSSSVVRFDVEIGLALGVDFFGVGEVLEVPFPMRN